MYEVNKPRLLKLIKFLETLKTKEFDFTEVVRKRNDKECGTICCAIGWTPVVFPTLVEFCYQDVKMKYNARYQEYDQVANKLFGMKTQLASNLFCPDSQKDVHPSLRNCGDKARPKTVAKMLRHFLKLVEDFEITRHIIKGAADGKY